MRDVDDRDAVGAQPPDDAEQILDLGVGQRRRRLVEDEHARVERQRAGDGHHRLLHGREVAGEGAQRDALAEPVELPLRLAPHRTPVHDAARRRCALGECDVLGDGDRLDDRQLLVQGDHAGAVRRLHIGEVGALAADAHLAVVLAVHPGDDFDQRRLARPVLAEQGVHFACAHFEVDAAEGLHAVEVLRDAAHVEREFRRLGGRRGHRASSASGLHRMMTFGCVPETCIRNASAASSMSYTDWANSSRSSCGSSCTARGNA